MHRDLGEAGAEDVAVRVGGKAVAELTGLGDDDVAPRLAGVLDPLREQRVLAALAPMLGQGRGEAEVPDTLGDEDAGRAPPARRRRARASSPNPVRGARAAQGTTASGRP